MATVLSSEWSPGGGGVQHQRLLGCMQGENSLSLMKCLMSHDNRDLCSISETDIVVVCRYLAHRFLECTGCPVKLFPLGYLLFCRLLLMQIAKVGTFLKNLGNLLHNRHKNFENRIRNSRDN